MFLRQSDGNSPLPKLNFTQLVTATLKILGRRSLKDVALLEIAQLIFVIFHTFVFVFFLHASVYPAKFTDIAWKIRKIN